MIQWCTQCLTPESTARIATRAYELRAKAYESKNDVSHALKDYESAHQRLDRRIQLQKQGMEIDTVQSTESLEQEFREVQDTIDRLRGK